MGLIVFVLLPLQLQAPHQPFPSIMNAAGWVRESTFRKFYDKPADSESSNFGEQLLLHCNEKH